MNFGSIVELVSPIAGVVFPVVAVAIKLAAKGFQRDVTEAVTASKEAVEASQAVYDEYQKANADDNITAEEVAHISDKLGVAVKEMGEAVKEMGDVVARGTGIISRFRSKRTK